MYLTEEMKVNKFKDVKIPKKAEFFMRSGYIEDGSLKYTGDNFAPTDGRKIDNISSMLQEDARQETESKK